MKNNKVVDITIWIFNLLVFLVSLLLLVCYLFFIFEKSGAYQFEKEILFLLIPSAICVAWFAFKSGKWLTAPIEQINVMTLLVFCFFLIFFYLIFGFAIVSTSCRTGG